MPIVITWDPVEDSHPELGNEGEIDVELYQVVLEGEEVGLTVDLPAEITELVVAPGLFEAGEEVKIEVLVREETGNQTATESCFAIDE